jgi:hypothetical protein
MISDTIVVQFGLGARREVPKPSSTKRATSNNAHNSN